MHRPTLVALACLLATPVLAQEPWPNAQTQKLEVSALGITVSVPAPEWIDQAAYDQGYANESGIETSWFIGGGFDSRGSSLNVTIQTIDDWEQGAQRHSFAYDASSCDTLEYPKPPRIEDVFEFTVICGRDFGTGRGVLYYGQARRVGEDHVADVWYVTEVEPFYANNASSWPMPEAELIAMWERLRAAITVNGP
jgi:hypothetical protein